MAFVGFIQGCVVQIAAADGPITEAAQFTNFLDPIFIAVLPDSQVGILGIAGRN